MNEPGDQDYIMDFQKAGEGDAGNAPLGGRSLRGRPWVGIVFECCGLYARVYRNRDATAYEGRCPGCTRRVKLRVGPGGTDCRFFSAG